MRIREGLKSIDILEAWKVILGRSFPYPDFKVCLCEPTNAVSSTMAEMIVIPSQDSVNASLQSIVHEAGAHFIGPKDWAENAKLSAILEEDMEGLIRMVEAAICYLKPEVFRRMRVKVDEDSFLVGMRLEREVAVFGSIWMKSKVHEINEAIAKAYAKMRQS